MNNPEHGIAGFRLTEHTWMTELGNWIDAISPDGRRAGALLFDARLIGLPGVRERVVAAVLTDQRLVLGGLTGLIPVADVVAAGDQVWLLTGQAVSPTLADLLTTAPIEPAGAASALVETAQTLIALHAAGVTHGSVHPGTVVVTSEGAALLSERGLSDAIRGLVSPPERDAAGWAALARGLAASFVAWAPQAAQLFERAAGLAGTLGLAAARGALLAEQASLPGGTIGREGLARAARGRSAFAQPAAHAAAAALPPLPRDEGDIVTLLAPGRVWPGHPGPGQSGSGLAGPGQSGLGQSGPGYAGPGQSGAGLAGPEQAGRSGAVQFGPGVSTQEQRPATTAEQIWRSGRPEADTVQRGGGGAGGRRVRAARSRRWRTIGSTALFAVIMVGAILAWFRLSDAPDLAIGSVDVKVAKKSYGCDATALVTGVVVTNGGSGVITYEWHKNLDDEVVKGTLQTRSDQTSYQLPLRWSLNGKATAKATATLRIVSPEPARTDKVSFTYKC
ncbi:protein kinase family protein [Nonomuraea wenchangensis]|uniref:Uncharacterized protein n=1 Tax=Nonomuraea wenchangensis TaxID=568860 RepID=A0A1I0CQ29_9ACTN|nr:hypothetical protein [Nonomuraea wenchangensis]SET21392.1 hypothetical protein SAMN05421811_102396 [Nonomuraea wenchangensis]